MFNDSLERARHAFRLGRYAEALPLVRMSTVTGQSDTDERNCLLCECLQFHGEFQDALVRADAALSREPSVGHMARYWNVIGRIRLDQQRREDAAEAFRKALRAAEKAGCLETLAEIQQLSLITLAENLGAGLTSAVREAYATAVRTADAGILAGFHIRLARLEGQRGAFSQSLHHLSLAKSLLNRADNIALAALLHVNKACVLTLLGRFNDARSKEK